MKTPHEANAIEMPDGTRIPVVPGMDAEKIQRAIAHPKAAEVLPALFAQEGPSALAQGDPAPDFELSRLHGDEGEKGERVRLSDHFGPQGRPVALVFGSYT